MRLCITVAITALVLESLTQARADELTVRDVGVGGGYYQDRGQNHRYDQSLSAVVPLTQLALTIAGDSRWATDQHGSARTQAMLFGLNYGSLPSWLLKGRVGLVRFDAGTKPAGMVDLLDKGSLGDLHLLAEYTPLFDTAELIRNELMFAGLELDGKASLHPRFKPAVHVFLRDYSDNNDSVRVRGDLPCAVILSPVRWEVGYRQEFAAFRRQTNDGYFAPDELHSFQGVSALSYWKEELSASVEVSGGVQQTQVSGNRTTDGFFGFYAEAAMRMLGSFHVGITAEGGDYALGSPSGFRYIQIAVRLTKNV